MRLVGLLIGAAGWQRPAHVAALAHVCPRLALGIVVGAVFGRAYSAARQQQREQPACRVTHTATRRRLKAHAALDGRETLSLSES